MAARTASFAAVAFPKGLRPLARHHGLQTQYLDMRGHVVHASPESLIAALRILGVPIDRAGDCVEALRCARAAVESRALPPVVIAWNGRLPSRGLAMPGNRFGGKARIEIRLENGEVRQADGVMTSLIQAPAIRAGKRSIDRLLSERLPTGYHQIAVHHGSRTFHTLVLSSPLRAFAEPGPSRSWGFFTPLYALRSEGDWGAGDFAGLSRLSEWLSRRGGDVVATLPLLPLFLDQPFEPSPYSPITRLFWSEFYLNLELIPEIESCSTARKMLASSAVRRCITELRASDTVRYRALAALKRSMLETLARHFFSRVTPRHRVFRKFLEDHPEVQTYAAFRAAHETNGADWSNWGKVARTGMPELGGGDMARRQYHLYSQWLAHEQMAEAARSARRHGVRLYLDLPLGVHPLGYDAWRFRKVFAQGATGGAPPDPVFTRGQSWGFAPLHPEALREEGYAYFRSCLRHHLCAAGILRFDHVMSLHRLYWIPDGLPASQGVYVRYPAEELYAVLNIESHRHRAMIVGENLGTVPAAVNGSLARHDVRGMHVSQYELEGGSRKRLPSPPVKCVASVNTHDMPPFAAYWRALDLRDRLALGLLNRTAFKRANAARKRLRKSLARRLQNAGHAGMSAILHTMWTHLSAGPAEIVIANLEDVWLETRPQNVPGTGVERANWRIKNRFFMEQWDRLPAVQRALKALERRPNP